jgi:hypothetical protein
MPPLSPCQKLCRLDAAGAACLSCGRTLQEIAGWSAYSEAERLAVMASLPERIRRRDMAASQQQ